MEQEYSLGGELGPWLKSDLLSEFSELLDEGVVGLEAKGREAVTLGSEDLLDPQIGSPSTDAGSQEAMPTDWIKNLMNSHDAEAEQLSYKSQQAFPGFPAAGALSVPISAKYGSSPLSSTRCQPLDSDMPSSWESNLSNFSLASSLDYTSVPEARQTKLKSENSFACSFETFYQEEEPRPEPQASKKSKTASKSESNPKASLADRNRERQQRFRQRQKAKIETLENQVVKLTSQTQVLLAEKADMGSQSAKLSELLQEKERMVAMLSNKVSQAHFHGGVGSSDADGDIPLISLSYCSPPLMLNKKQLSKMDALDLTKLWKEYVWALSNLLKVTNTAQWSAESERLDALTSELVQLMMHLWDSCPDFSSIKISGFAEDACRRDESEDENWRNIARQITLSPDQVQQLNLIRQTMRMRLSSVWQARREAHVRLINSFDESAVTSRDLLQQHQKIAQIHNILNSGSKEENLLARDFDFTFYKKVLRPEQRALCFVQAYPRFPDSQALAHWIAAGHGDEEALSMMTHHATSSSTSFHSS